MPSPHTNDPLHSDIPEEPAPMPTSDADAYARGREDERKAICAYLERASATTRAAAEAHRDMVMRRDAAELYIVSADTLAKAVKRIQDMKHLEADDV